MATVQCNELIESRFSVRRRVGSNFYDLPNPLSGFFNCVTSHESVIFR